MESKPKIRKRLLAKRESLEPSRRNTMSRIAEKELLGLEPLRSATKIGLYKSIRHEVSTDEVIEALKKQGKILFFPRMEKHLLAFVPFSFSENFIIGPWGVPEPKGRASPLKDLEIIIVPAIGFDEEGYRLGYGKGYYDRTLAEFKGITVGLAYDFQVLKTISHDAGDLQCDFIVTEKRVIVAKNKRSIPCKHKSSY